MTGSRKRPSEILIDRHVGARLQAFRLHRKWTQIELSERLGVSYQQIQKYERGANRISAAMLYKMARALGVGIAGFFEGLEEIDGRPSTGSGRTAELYKSVRAEPVEVRTDTAPYPSKSALKTAFAIDAIRSDKLKTAVTDLIDFAGKV